MRQWRKGSVRQKSRRRTKPRNESDSMPSLPIRSSHQETSLQYPCLQGFIRQSQLAHTLHHVCRSLLQSYLRPRPQSVHVSLLCKKCMRSLPKCHIPQLPLQRRLQVSRLGHSLEAKESQWPTLLLRSRRNHLHDTLLPMSLLVNLSGLLGFRVCTQCPDTTTLRILALLYRLRHSKLHPTRPSTLLQRRWEAVRTGTFQYPMGCLIHLESTLPDRCYQDGQA